jgi:hypothetical protein
MEERIKKPGVRGSNITVVEGLVTSVTKMADELGKLPEALGRLRKDLTGDDDLAVVAAMTQIKSAQEALVRAKSNIRRLLP